MKAERYQIITSDAFSQLTDIINNEIEDGWQPIGGVSICVERGIMTYAQAMILPEGDVL